MKIALAEGAHPYVVTADQMRELDRRATDEYGIPSLLLMENAGRAVAEVARDWLGGLCAEMVLVVCGPGNNGGDGFVAARHLSNASADVDVFYFGDRASAKGDALANLEMAEKMGIHIDHSRDVELLRSQIGRYRLVIDALLGTGTKGHLRQDMAAVVDAINSSSCFVIAVDIPSGLDADTGALLALDSGENAVLGAVRAHATVALGLPKIGLVTYPGAAYAGEVTAADIGIPSRAVHEQFDQYTCLIRPYMTLLPGSRSADAHKGSFGHTAIVAGSVGMTGAATLAAEGALRIGTGLVTVLIPESLNDIMEVKLTEAMTIPVPQGNARAFGMASLESVLEYVNKWDSAVIGPGFGRDEDTIAFTLALIRKLKTPAIIDADALYAVSTDLSVLGKCKASLVLTPHPGEMAALLGTTTEQVQSNRLEAARSFAKEHGVTVVLKGAGTVIAEPEGDAYINTTGTPGMATGGTGDVLSGMMGGLLVQERRRTYAATAAVYLHGLAGEIAARKRGEAAMIASDLADSIGDAIREVQQADSQ